MRGDDAKENTVRAIIRTVCAPNGEISVKEGGSDEFKVTPDIKSKTEEILSENCTLSLPEINLRLQKNYHLKKNSRQK